MTSTRERCRPGRRCSRRRLPDPLDVLRVFTDQPLTNLIDERRDSPVSYRTGVRSDFTPPSNTFIRVDLNKHKILGSSLLAVVSRTVVPGCADYPRSGVGNFHVRILLVLILRAGCFNPLRYSAIMCLFRPRSTSNSLTLANLGLEYRG